MRTLIAATLLLATVSAGEKPGDAAKKDAEWLQGTWRVVSGEMGGQKLPDDIAKTLTFIFEGDTLTIREGERVAEKSTYKLDPSRVPKAIDSTVPGQDKAIPGIYELAGDTLKLCWSKGGGERPAKFESKAGTDLMLATLKREKK